MESQRAHQIVSSPDEIMVSYNGVSVWIDKIHDDDRTATVHLRQAMEERSEVAISELKKH
ncbi:H-type small acid-soluble spore protein [Sporosarcina luteola]|uniref:H-type small acid-soluble spore protein n=1 Tax=Sporosarcina luteola TaxID=582850 RepID=UPI00203E1B09|nr:H-type small acid-soluble spore protein [Sporosarcina luteola]MCM3636995.1 H-type small acid-soluble spore protein [Sporosarcina luteola]